MHLNVPEQLCMKACENRIANLQIQFTSHPLILIRIFNPEKNQISE
jgi:hypothetical protein